MPNWNLNYMDVKGKDESVKTVLNFVKENYNTERKEGKPEDLSYVLDFEKYLPTPKDDKGEIIDNWYDWRLENWGCKWSPLSDQFNHLHVIYENGESCCYENMVIDNEEFEFNEKNIDKLLDEVDKIKEISLNVTFDTPWCPPYGIIGKWSERYKDVELVNKYYEPGCGFVGKMGFNNDEGLFDECYDCSEMEPYLTYLLEEGFESVDWYIEEIYMWIEEMYKEEKGDEFVNTLFNKVKEQIENEKDNKNIAKLICEIHDKYIDYCNNNKENK
jgi:hypothetical protein